MGFVRILPTISVLTIVMFVTACSNSKSKKPSKSEKIIKHQVDNKKKKKAEMKVYASLLDEWKKQGLLKPEASKQKPKQQKVSLKKPAKVKTVHTAKKHIKRKVTKANTRKTYKAPIYRAPVSKARYASLSGDYARNPKTTVFINKMVSKHGFDRGYLNYLFTHTKATPFLKRMAFADAYGRKKSTRKSRAGRWNRYRGNFLTERTISKGVQFWRENKVALQRAEQQYGVPKEYILGIIGVETRYGGNVGKNRAIDALSAMGFDNPRRGKYFTSELEAYLLMTRQERLDPLKPMASYAGALGLSQFMPSNIKRYAVDHDRSGSVNLWTPHDAIGSVANYFKKHGWKTGGTVAVRASSSNSGYKSLKTGFKTNHSLARLKSRGVSADNIGNISGKARLIKLNTYSGDELWLGGHNFYVITRYNHSSHYAMAVHQLAQAIKGRIGGGMIRQVSLDKVIPPLN